MTIEDILSKESPRDVIIELMSGRGTAIPDVEGANRYLDPKLHDVNNPILRPDKRVKLNQEGGGDKVIDTGEEGGGYRIEKVARVSLAIQKLIIKRAVSFLFGNAVAYNATPENDNQEIVLKALNRILYDTKSTSMNRKVARAVFGFKECAELWYPVPSKSSYYGFDSGYKLRCALFSPAFGDVLYPYFDDTGDMIAFSRGFSRKTKEGVSIGYFETYTDSLHIVWREGQNGYELLEGFPKKTAIGKIPVVYAYQPEFETQDVNSLIDRLEKLLSNFADTNDYHASPKIFITGEMKGFSKKGEPGAILEGEQGATAQYLAWQNAPESVKTEVATLLQMIYTITQTPDISFDSVKGLGAISGIALKLLFMDAHLKVQDKREVFDEYLQRRVNIIKAYIGQFNQSLVQDIDLLEIEPEISPYMLTNEIDEVNMWLAANGNKPLVSQKQSVKAANLSQDPTADYEQIQEEAASDKYTSSFEPTI